MDLITKRALSALELTAFKFAMIDRTRASGDDIAFVMFNPENLELAKLASFPFVSVPDSTLPHPTPIFLHQRNNVLSEEAAKTLFFMVGDLDYF